MVKNLTYEEKEFLRKYRKLDAEDKKYIDGLFEALDTRRKGWAVCSDGRQHK